ncbi:hypothetical protein OMP43_17620 [Sphingomonas sp. CBMAI 2297]|uniref:hypothetical protein n=1 Tax=Sphingomonas sp. CBMAI 2297 TaxID=2991720 RepID=UPI0024563599|nr:hypothetical protein [Sphingomonas sp. CBMAI 2297]MDH4745847.1 hypothetical protein [Sphingomonas sp. CBMAI 2297]
MAKNRKAARRALVLGGIAAIVASGAWLVQRGADGADRPVEGLVRVDMPAMTASSPPSAALPAAHLPALPDKVIAHVRQAYPLLTEVDFRCDAGGCAVTATIPPPTGDAFLKQRQEMLLGGLARTVAADGYTMLGPVQMDEVAFNVFRIRAAVAQARGQVR